MLQTKHFMIILIVVLLLFGTKKLRAIGPDLGAAVRSFRRALNQKGASSTSSRAQVDPD